MRVCEHSGPIVIEVLAEGPRGLNGWVPILAVVQDGERSVQQVADWAGGTGAKPAVGQYVGEDGFVNSIDDASDIRGPVGDLTPEAQAAAELVAINADRAEEAKSVAQDNAAQAIEASGEAQQAQSVAAAQASRSEQYSGEAVAAAGVATGAKDAALIQAGVYTTEPIGRAAVQNGQAFKVQGDGTVIAAYEYRRIDASSSSLIATYPAGQLVQAIDARTGDISSAEPYAVVMATDDGMVQHESNTIGFHGPTWTILSEGGAALLEVRDSDGVVYLTLDTIGLHAAGWSILPNETNKLLLTSEDGMVYFDSSDVQSSDLGDLPQRMTAAEVAIAQLQAQIPGAFNVNWDVGPLLGGTIPGFIDKPVHIYGRNIMPVRSDLSRVRLAVESIRSNYDDYEAVGDDDVRIDLARCGPTINVYARASEAQINTRNAVMGLRTWAAPVTGTGSPVILFIGDSLTHIELAARTKGMLNQRGLTPIFVGTMTGQAVQASSTEPALLGQPGEGRSSRGFDDYTYQRPFDPLDDSTSQPVPIGGEAAYLAGSSLADRERRKGYNPFLRAATGSDAPGDVFNGYTVDMVQYGTRFGVEVPKGIMVGLGTNDAGRYEDPTTIVTNGIRILYNRCREWAPNAHIAFAVPPVSRSTQRDGRWPRYVKVIQAILAYHRTVNDPKFHILPFWAMGSQENGWALNNVAPDQYGVVKADAVDWLHFGPFGRQRYANMHAAFIAGVAAGLN